MPFPMSAAGSFDIDVGAASGQPVSDLKTSVMDWLAVEHAHDISSTADGITFKVRVFRNVAFWNPLIAINAGYVQFLRSGTSLHVSYRLEFAQTLLVTIAFLVLFFGPFLWTRLDIMGLSASLLFFWTLSFGAAYLRGRRRFAKMLRRKVKDAMSEKS